MTPEDMHCTNRYLVRCRCECAVIVEAANGDEAIERARQQPPQDWPHIAWSAFSAVEQEPTQAAPFTYAASAAGTSLRGTFRATYQQVVAAFGEPNSTGDDYKVTTEWVLRFANGTLVTIYDWKETSKYDDELPQPSYVRSGALIEWHIGGHNYDAVRCVQKYFADAKGGDW